jgi:hypothetical protein
VIRGCVNSSGHNLKAITEVPCKSLRRPLLGGLMGGSCLKVGRATG